MAKPHGGDLCDYSGERVALLWTGVISSLAALAWQVFAGAADAAGVDLDAAWRLIAFGLFLITVAALIGRRERATPRARR